MRRFAVLLVALTATALTARADAVELAETEWYSRMTYGHGTDESTTTEAALLVQPRFGISAGSAWIEISARARFDPADELEPSEPDYDYYTDASRPATFGDDTTMELRDFYLELPLGSSLLRLGKQQLVWGNLDGLRVLDQMNPHSFREFILADFDESRINLWSAYLDTRLFGWQTELVWTPDTTVHDIPEAGAWFEFQAPRFRYGAPADAPLPELATELPTSMIDDATYGVRLSRRLGRFDVRLQAQTGLDYEPLGRTELTESGLRLVQSYERREIYGLSFEGSVGDLVLRGEFAAQPDRRFNVRTGEGLGNMDGDQWTAALGVDVDGPFGTFINAQYVYDKITDAPDGLVRPDDDHIATVFARRPFAYEAVTAELRWYGTLDEGDGLTRASLEWAASDSVRLGIGMDLFYGDEDGLFGQFRSRDRITATVSLTL